ncbi:DUF1640 family protein [Schizosaccharomyces japonicus yFS275]|uniref:DUF1640 family protein n=1 Tax=Schizosaccharomyces japonicus (strain yFS275 / FY16936) TaxID=402676 RepID=B6K5A3_SCHJY|nr:DUF1640 family protein [Schizosaccharomyces japonicus yFS275]EEB08707.1 DUF1640 family protein [Schizosaccharomyces japonicus yFS275]
MLVGLKTVQRLHRGILWGRYSIRPLNVADQRSFHAFDTLKFVRGLEAAGWTPVEANSIMRTVHDVFTKTNERNARQFVSREQQERAIYQQKVDFAHLRSDLQSIEREEMTVLHTELERLSTDVERLRTSFEDRIHTLLADARLKMLTERIHNRDEASAQDLEVREVSARVHTEASHLRMQFASLKSQTLQWLLGIITGSGALLLAYLRLLL